MATHAQVAIYGMASEGRLAGSTSSVCSLTCITYNTDNSWARGGTFGIYDNFLKLGPLKLGSDARFFFQDHDRQVALAQPNKIRGGLAGLRLALSAPLIPFKPYIQAEVGGVGTNFGIYTDTRTAFAYQVQLGADFTIIPHLDLRAEYGAGQISSNPRTVTTSSTTLQQAGIGAVVRF